VPRIHLYKFRWGVSSRVQLLFWQELWTFVFTLYSTGADKRMKYFLASVLFMIAVLLELVLVVVFRRMMDEVNAAISGSHKIPEFGPSWLRGKVIRLHRRYYPGSTLQKGCICYGC